MYQYNILYMCILFWWFSSIVRWLCNWLVTKHSIVICGQKFSPFTSTVERNKDHCYVSGLSVMGVWLLLVGLVMCARTVEHDDVTFSDRSIAVQWWERLTWWATVLIQCPCSLWNKRCMAVHNLTKGSNVHVNSPVRVWGWRSGRRASTLYTNYQWV